MTCNRNPYDVEFKLGNLVKSVQERRFKFRVETIKPAFTLKKTDLDPLTWSEDKMELTGSIETADVENGELVEKILSVSVNGSSQ
jgi:hypothetical protein